MAERLKFDNFGLVNMRRSSKQPHGKLERLARQPIYQERRPHRIQLKCFNQLLALWSVDLRMD